MALLRFVDPPVTAFMLERAVGAWWQGERDFRLRYEWVPLAEIPEPVQRAVIAAEDQRFFEHRGFDWGAIGDALQDRAEGERLRGASTLTQQVARNLFLWSGRSFLRKALEAWFTLWIEALWPKQRVLEMHLNVAELGDGIYGVGAAARAWFGVPARALGAEQGARLAAVLPSPRRLRADARSGTVVRRRDWILSQMRRLPPLPAP